MSGTESETREVAPTPEELEPVRHRWARSDRFVARSFVRPVTTFMETEAAGAVLMLVAAVVAVAWANSPWQDSYFELWSTHVAIDLGTSLHVDLTLQEWVNDALMAIFFFVVALEIKRELVQGELNDRKKAALPAMAALGGMLLPALIYVAFNAGTDASSGWGIPVATDIAFAVGVVALVGPRIPTQAKIFLLTLAIVDDVGGILIIAVFYTSDLSFGWLAVGAGAVVLLWVFQRVDIRAMSVYVFGAIFIWFACHESGVHATIAGVVLGLLTPAWAFYDPAQFAPHARRLVDRIQRRFDDETLTVHELEENDAEVAELVRLSEESISPLARLLHRLGPLVAFVIVPLFALSNAGVTFTADSVDGLVTDRIVLGVVLGLLVGKTVGVFSFTWVATRLGLGRLPSGTSWAHVFGLSVTAGIGFTVALFITTLAFDDPDLSDSAKIGVFIASIIAGIAGYLILRTMGGRHPADEQRETAET